MFTYTVELKNGNVHEVSAQRVIEKNGLVNFCNDRKSITEQYLNGPEIVAAFNISDVLYFRQKW